MSGWDKANKAHKEAELSGAKFFGKTEESKCNSERMSAADEKNKMKELRLSKHKGSSRNAKTVSFLCGYDFGFIDAFKYLNKIYSSGGSEFQYGLHQSDHDFIKSIIYYLEKDDCPAPTITQTKAGALE